MRDKGVSSFTIFKWNLFVKSVTSSCSDDTCCDACYGSSGCANRSAHWATKRASRCACNRIRNHGSDDDSCGQTCRTCDGFLSGRVRRNHLVSKICDSNGGCCF